MTTAYFHLVKQLLSGVWAITPEAAQAAMPIVIRLLEGKGEIVQNSKNHETNDFKMATIDAGGIIHLRDYRTEPSSSRKNGAQAKNIAIISISGAISKYSQDCGPAGTQEIGRQVQHADANPEIDGILLKIDSPGGMVDGTNTLAAIIKNAQKPILSFVDSGTMASAAYWIGSAGKEIWASEKTDVIGSIGVMCSFVDMKGYYDKLGAKVHEIYSTLSADKNADFSQATQGNYEPLQKNVLDKIATEFIDTVKAYRNDKIKSEALTGKTYMAQDAIKVGLIDKIGTISEALQRVAKLADTQKQASKTANSQTQDMNIFSGIRWESIKALLGFSFSASEDGKVQLSESHVDRLDESIKAANVLTLENTTLKAEIESLKTANGTLLKEKEELQAKLDSKPAAGATALTGKESDDEAKAKTNSAEDRIKSQAAFLKKFENSRK